MSKYHNKLVLSQNISIALKVVLTTDPVRAASKESSKYGITRGASYYGGGDRS